MWVLYNILIETKAYSGSLEFVFASAFLKGGRRIGSIQFMVSKLITQHCTSTRERLHHETQRDKSSAT